MSDFAVFMLIWLVVAGLIWLVIGWRAMRAHERIADRLGDFLSSLRDGRPGTPPQGPGPAAPSPRQDVLDRLTRGGG